VYFLHVRNSVDEIIWSAIQNKLENVGQALDGQDRGMEVTAARTMPDRGQKALDTYFTTQVMAAPAAPPAAAAAPPLQQQPQQIGARSDAIDKSRKFFPQGSGLENEAAGDADHGGQKRPRNNVNDKNIKINK